MMRVEGYYEYTGVCSVHRDFPTNSMVLSTTFLILITASPGVLTISSQFTEHPLCILPLYSEHLTSTSVLRTPSVLRQGGHPFLTLKFHICIFVFFKNSSCHVKGATCNDQSSLLLTVGSVGAL